MLTCTLWLSLCAAAAPVTVSTLDGVEHQGTLEGLTSAGVVVAASAGTATIPLAEVRDVQISGVSPSPESGPVEVRLTDGSRFAATSCRLTGQQISFNGPTVGETALPRSDVSSVRLAAADRALADTWAELQSRGSAQDRVVVRKGDALDHVEGVVGKIDYQVVELLLEGSPIPIPAARVFGVIFAPTVEAPPASAPLARVELANGDLLVSRSVELRNDEFLVESVTGLSLAVAVSATSRLDFSLGKIQYLSDMEPSSVVYPTTHPLYLAEVWNYGRGQSPRGGQLRLGGRAYERGLWIHSGTTLRYRLGREYRRFRGMMGIDEEIGDCDPQLDVVFRGDGRELLKTTVRRGDAPHELDLDVQGVRELEIEVRLNDPNGICEHLDIVEARIIK
jgi:hypothetical protein